MPPAGFVAPAGAGAIVAGAVLPAGACGADGTAGVQAASSGMAAPATAPPATVRINPRLLKTLVLDMRVAPPLVAQHFGCAEESSVAARSQSPSRLGGVILLHELTRAVQRDLGPLCSRVARSPDLDPTRY